jgi:hypothetical protein
MINLPNIIFSLIMGCVMSLSITFATTYDRLGLPGNFFSEWMRVWLVAYPVAIVCILIYRPFVAKLTALLHAKMKASKKL